MDEMDLSSVTATVLKLKWRQLHAHVPYPVQFVAALDLKGESWQ